MPGNEAQPIWLLWCHWCWPISGEHQQLLGVFVDRLVADQYGAQHAEYASQSEAHARFECSVIIEENRLNAYQWQNPNEPGFYYDDEVE